MFKYIMETAKYNITAEPVFGATFNRMRQHMNETECCFITAFRGCFSVKVNQRRNDELRKRLKAEGFSFIGIQGGYREQTADGERQKVSEDSFFVINNKYTTDDFITRMCRLAEDVDIDRDFCPPNDPMKNNHEPENQDTILITIPTSPDNPSRSRPKVVDVIARLYTPTGQIVDEFTDISVNNITEYFSRLYNRAFSFVSATTFISSINRDVRGPGGRQLAKKDFLYWEGV